MAWVMWSLEAGEMTTNQQDLILFLGWAATGLCNTKSCHSYIIFMLKLNLTDILGVLLTYVIRLRITFALQPGKSAGNTTMYEEHLNNNIILHVSLSFKFCTVSS